MASVVTGAKELDRKLAKLKRSVQNKVQRQAVLAGLRIITKAIKAEVPSTWKEGRKAIGFSFVRGKKQNIGQTFAKAGVGAGMKKKAREKRASNAKQRGKKKGIGIGVSNLHWFILGTQERFTGSKRVGAHRKGVVSRRVSTGKQRRRTGRMKPNPIVARGTQKSRAAAKTAIANNLKAGIEREAAKR